jgi:uncharacterized surface protein with fasciclin (FAS1) repeats
MKLRNYLSKTGIGLFISASVLFTGCKKEKTTPPVTNTITDVVVANSNFSVLKEAVVKAGLDGTLKGAGPYTVFAPDNAAFNAAGITSATVASLTSSQLQAVLLYHTLPANITAANVPAGPNAKVITASGDSVFVTRNISGVYVNGIAVAQADIKADNGTIHRLSKALNLPAGNIVQTAVAAGLDSLVKAITRATNGPGGDPTLTNTLSTATLSVFAPTNLAFTNLLAALSLTDINNIPMPTLLAVLRYHVKGGRAFSSDLSNGTLAMLAGGNTTINLTNGTGGGPTVLGNSNGGNKSNITATNIMCRNGVVHLIDRVLLP